MTPRTKSGDVLDVVPRARAAPSARGRRRGADGRCHARARPTRQGARSGLTWEVGPGLEREHGLVLSPGGVRERLVVTDAIVAAAPVGLASWEIHAARPPKRCDRRYQLQRRESWLEVDASAWRYTLVGCNQGEFFDVTLHVGSTLRDASDEERQRAAWLLLDESWVSVARSSGSAR